MIFETPFFIFYNDNKRYPRQIYDIYVNIYWRPCVKTNSRLPWVKKTAKKGEDLEPNRQMFFSNKLVFPSL